MEVRVLSRAVRGRLLGWGHPPEADPDAVVTVKTRYRCPILAAVLLLAGVCSAGGCSRLLRGGPAADTQSDRLMAAYPDLASGRFWVIADFEQFKHAELFHVVSHSGRGACLPSFSAGVPETGKCCLRVTLADPLDAVVINNEHAREWSLKRDWRQFWLLVGAVHCPVDSIPLELTIVAGPPGDGGRVHSRIVLTRGWNVLRLDLAEAAEHIPIDDVRELRLSLPEADGPVELLLDDFVLADNRQDVFGASDDLAEGLYVQSQGRRWNIGAAGRFELGFANGQIVHWYDLGSDPHRVRNLVAGSVLGPSPTVMPGYDDEVTAQADSGFLALGETVVARQQLIEAGPVRIIVRCRWQFTSPGQETEEAAPFQRWIYTILPDGKVHVSVECTSRAGDWTPEELGLAVTVSDDGSVRTYPHRPAQLQDPADLRRLAFCYARPAAAERPGVLLVMHDGRRAPVMEAVRQPQRRRVSLLASGGHISGPTQSWSCLLKVWPVGHCEQAADQALDYCYPDSLEVQVGGRVNDSPGDDDGDGFNERYGCYVLRPEGDLLRFVIDGTARPRFAPVFNILDTVGSRVWVYVDNVILEAVGRDAGGNVLFRLPETVRGRRLIEVVVRGQMPLSRS